MQNEVYGLQYDYIFQQGHYLTMNKQDGPLSDVLIKHQVKMLQNNDIPRFLPLEVEQIDDNIRLRYRLTGTRMLSQALKAGKMTTNDYLQLLLRLVMALQDSKLYMLSEDNFILHQDFIFVGNDYSDVYLTYLPIQDLPRSHTLQEAITELAAQWIGSIDEIKGNGVQQIMKLLVKEELQLDELKQLLLKAMEEAIFPVGLQERESMAEQVAENDEGCVNQGESMNFKDPSKSVNNALVHIREPSSKVMIAAKNRRELPPAFRYGAISAAVLIAACIWLLYARIKGEGMLFVSFGTTLLIMDLLFLYFSMYSPHRTKSAALSVNECSVNNEAGTITEFSAAGIEPDAAHRRLENRTTLLTRPDATVLLNSASEQMQASLFLAYLQVGHDEPLHSIPIQGNSFIIGREASPEVDYADCSLGVSRVHCEIVRVGSMDSMFGVKDLGSKNGSFLNEQLLVPYKVYPLQDGDVIKIVRTEMIFKTRTS